MNIAISTFLNPLLFLLVLLLLSIILFEILPFILYGREILLRGKWSEIINYQIVRTYVMIMVVGIITNTLNLTWFGKGFIDISYFNYVEQIIILYLSAELLIYMSHFMAHKYSRTSISRAHAFHHVIRENMDWTNARREHYFILFLFSLIFCLIFTVVFKADPLSKLFTFSIYLMLNSMSHYRLRFKLPILDQILLFPLDHYRHHNHAKSGPYGVTLSVFDTIFGTRN